ncbi:S9 family peptidase [Rheinheimera sp. MMS21-TC3]|uniref:S9 family peptidase n=1 Tax=Rheinheimera sp. MMS21-TC3 TaxID=3072790 RepID=UPI0028C44F43|nr:S9 family peptidase [Rheinheimera sp. MMS21-TC3]WNO61514.1 S9 family peptidase [Rheinheimera sp. MMS21-TC3]
MKLKTITNYLCLPLFLIYTASISAAEVKPLQYEDVFDLEFVSDPQPDAAGKRVVFVRNWMDKQTDRRRSTLWLSTVDGKSLQPLTDKDINASSPRWSPDQNRLAYIVNGQIHVKWLDTGSSSQLGQLASSPSNISWSPDGHWLAFSMFTEKNMQAPITLAGKPVGADWAKPAIYIDNKQYRVDGAGYTKLGFRHIYIMSSNGGSAIQLTEGDYNHSGDISWSLDSKSLYFSTNRQPDWQSKPVNTEIYKLDISTRKLIALTERDGPDSKPTLSPDGKLIAYVGYDDRKLGHQANRLYVMNLDGSNKRNLTEDLDRAIDSFQWQANSKGLYIQYDSEGAGILASQSLSGKRSTLVSDLGGGSYSRPYSGGQFSAADTGIIAYTQMSAKHPAELAIVSKGKTKTITDFNADLVFNRSISKVEEIWYSSTVDKRNLQGWVMYPPNFDPSKQYPLILEIHGGPHTAYGPQFAMELQLMAAKGYVVLYTNPRGSTSYGEDFANLIHHNYPSTDFNDLMDGVDAVIAKGFIDEKQLFVTGGSGGGVLTAWIVGHTDRFAAAVSVKPVINWFSFVLNADMYSYFSQYWFPALPWQNPEHYLKYSPISYVGNVTTPTMLMTGEADYRTPISETEQFYQALQLQGVETAMVRIPEASHSIYSRPSNLMAKTAYILYWFDKYRSDKAK